MTTTKDLNTKIDTVVESMRELHRTGENRSLSWRRAQLNNLHQMLTQHRDEFYEAIYQDLHKSRIEAEVCELSIVEGGISHMLRNLSSYVTPQKVPSPGILTPCFSEIRWEPLRSPAVLIIAPFNYPIHLSLLPAVGSLAAGNPTVIKPSELTQAVSKLLARLVPRYFSASSLAIVEGGIPETTALLERPWGMVCFTGSPAVGAIVASQAGRTLTPTLLELGGKSPTYIDVDCPDMDVTADRVAWGKLLNSGQTCVAPDYVLVHQKIRDEFVAKVTAAMNRMHGNDGNKNNLVKIVNEKQARRLVELIRDAEKNEKSTIAFGGSEACDPESRRVAPTVILDPQPESKVLKAEIFGPILPVISVNSDDDAIQYIQRQQGLATPLALYVFTTKARVFEKFAASCPSAAIVRNDLCVHLSSHDLPIGGLGTSGYGAYHGKASFEAFSHRRAMVYKPAHWLFEFGGIRYVPNDGLRGKLLLAMTKIPALPVLPWKEFMAVGLLLMIYMGAKTPDLLGLLRDWSKKYVQEAYK